MSCILKFVGMTFVGLADMTKGLLVTTNWCNKSPIKRLQHSCQDSTTLLQHSCQDTSRTPAGLLQHFCQESYGTPIVSYQETVANMLEYVSFLLQCITTIILGTTAYYMYSLIKWLRKLLMNYYRRYHTIP